MPGQDEIGMARIEIEISVSNLEEEHPDIRVGHPRIVTLQIPRELQGKPEFWMKAMAIVAPLMREVQKITGIAVAQVITEQDPRRH